MRAAAAGRSRARRNAIVVRRGAWPGHPRAGGGGCGIGEYRAGEDLAVGRSDGHSEPHVVLVRLISIGPAATRSSARPCRSRRRSCSSGRPSTGDVLALGADHRDARPTKAGAGCRAPPAWPQRGGAGEVCAPRPAIATSGRSGSQGAQVQRGAHRGWSGASSDASADAVRDACRPAAAVAYGCGAERDDERQLRGQGGGERTNKGRKRRHGTRHGTPGRGWPGRRSWLARGLLAGTPGPDLHRLSGGAPEREFKRQPAAAARSGPPPRRATRPAPAPPRRAPGEDPAPDLDRARDGRPPRQGAV